MRKVKESMQREAFIFKAKDSLWYYFIAHEEFGRYPNGDFYGPFTNKDTAFDHMLDNHSNPGGFHVDDSGRNAPPKRPISSTSFRWSY